MGVEWYPCGSCGQTFPDCISYDSCLCGAYFCGNCIEGQSKYGFDEDGELLECDGCTKSIIRDNDVMEWLLKKCNMKREEAVTDIENERKEKSRS